jgi:uncharacterized membrane protein (UPF0127 family)
VLASLEVAEGRTARARGLLGRTSLEGALLLQPARSVHTIGMRFPIDVAYCDAQFQVVEVITMARNRVGRPRLSCRSVVEAEAGSFERWGLKSGMDLEVKE